jgi:multiple antibiotic resistance protein
MGNMLSDIFNITLFLIALINPISKIVVISVFPDTVSFRETARISIRSTVAAFVMLVAFAVSGHFILNTVFHVELYAFQIVGGIVVFFYGFQALRQGVFFEADAHQNIMDLSIVPIASPLIAGPATITATISLCAQNPIPLVIAAIAAALAVNLLFMILARFISKPLEKVNLMGALIRITGLFVAAIGVNLALNGIKAFVQAM